ncbi:MAG: ELM1/GtrOC1 family putative glycosyltransferase [Candidatus Omnitrophota bacterium]|jgi:KDO2-lipid IV(A) lauroyltransferase
MRYSLSEYILFIEIRLVSILLQVLPVGFALFIGRVLGIIAWWLDSKHKRSAYRNLRIALAKECSNSQLKTILKRNYQNWGMSMVELFRLPKIDKNYIDRHIKIIGRENLDNALNNKKGAIILGAHFGSWETCFAVAGLLKYPLCIFAEEQSKNPLLDNLLNQTRQNKGVEVLRVSDKLHQVISNLKQGKFVGMVADHGAREGVFVDFFGRKTRTPSTALRISLKFGVPILIGYIRRIRGPEHELVILPPLVVKRTDNLKQDIIAGLEMINQIVQAYITKYPQQYLWFYKRFKYSSQRNILLLHDGRAGHLRQGEALIRVIKNIAHKKDLEIKIKQVKIDFRGKHGSLLQSLSLSLSHRNACQGCLWCLKGLLRPDTFKELQSYFADIVISCGWRTAAVNYVISGENQAKSIVLMRPGPLSINRFDLVIMPFHDNPPNRHNLFVTQGALNLVDDQYIASCALRLAPYVKIDKQLVLGLLLGGDTKRFKLSLEQLRPLISQTKLFLEKHDGLILITTSRRTSSQAEHLIKQEFGSYVRCRLLVIANEKNLDFAVGGILGLSKMVIVSPESISMISEAASSGKCVLVFNPRANIGKRHSRFLNHLAQKRCIYLSDSTQISKSLEEIVISNPKIMRLQDGLQLEQRLSRLIS